MSLSTRLNPHLVMSLLTRLTPHLVISVTVYSAEPALGSQGQLVDQIYPQGNQNDPVNAYKFSKFTYKFSNFGVYNIEASLVLTILKHKYTIDTEERQYPSSMIYTTFLCVTSFSGVKLVNCCQRM